MFDVPSYMDYRELAPADRNKIVYDLKVQGRSNAEIMKMLGVPPTAERRIRDWASQHAAANSLPFPIQVNQYQRWDERNPYLINMHKDPYMEADQPQFEAALNDLYEDNDRICVMFATDVHFPYEVGGAVNVYFDYLERLQPHVIVRGSDALEASNLGKFPISVAESVEDCMGEAVERMTRFYETENQIVGDAVKFWLMGNHDLRYFKWFRQHAPQVSDFVERSLIQTIRNLDTYWLGETCDVVAFDELCVSHGVHVGANAADKMYAAYGKQYKVSVMGHVHRTKVFTDMETRFDYGKTHKVMREAHSVGALSGIDPHYSHSRAKSYRHNLGFFYAFVDPHRHTVEPHNLIIDHNDFSVREVAA